MVLQKNDRLLVQVSSKLLMRRCVDERGPIALLRSRVWVFEQTHLKLHTEQSGNGGINERDIKFAGFN